MATNSQIAFAPLGKTVVVAADAVAPDGVLVPVNPPSLETGQIRIVNSSANIVHLGVGSTAASAKANAAAAAAGVPAAGIPLVAGAVEVMRFAPGLFYSGICAAGASTLFLTPGEGL